MKQEQDDSAKFVFWYLLSLVALIFVALPTGMIIFQVINNYIAEPYFGFRSQEVSQGVLRFAISSLLVFTPVFYVSTIQIQKGVRSGKLNPESTVRKWLGYLILFVSSVIMFIWAIITINNFMSGELTLRFALKFLTVLVISGSIFAFYFYDLKRKVLPEGRDWIMYLFGGLSLLVIVISFVSALFLVESPWEARERKIDEEVIRNLSSLETSIQGYYDDQGVLPESLEKLSSPSLSESDLFDPITGDAYEYNILGPEEYELCAEFRSSSDSWEVTRYPVSRWSYDQGYNCFKLDIYTDSGSPRPTIEFNRP